MPQSRFRETVVEALRGHPEYILAFAIIAIVLGGAMLNILTNTDPWPIVAVIALCLLFAIFVVLITRSQPDASQADHDSDNEQTFLGQFTEIRDALLGITEASNSDDDQPIIDAIDKIGAAQLRTLSMSVLGESPGLITDTLAQDLNKRLPKSSSICATDVLGPASWISPQAYVYLATQIRWYAATNVYHSKWSITVSKRLHSAIKRACTNACQHLRESGTLFDNPEQLEVAEGAPQLEFSRVLLWTKAELMSPIADWVIRIHEAFHVPLFFLEVASSDNAQRRQDYILIELEEGGYAGWYNMPDVERAPAQLTPFGSIRGIFDCVGDYNTLLERNELMFAIDARLIAMNAHQGV